tara:strand:+ start:523 stop:798 length:276 start_codon:yes stop_codon:yes gene_type:complete
MLKENKEVFILLTPERLMMDNGLVDLEMDMEHKNGQTVRYILVNGITTEPKAKVNSFILTEMCMKATGSMIKQTDLEFIITLMELFMKVNG